MCLQHVLSCYKHFIGPTLSSMMYILEMLTKKRKFGRFGRSILGDLGDRPAKNPRKIAQIAQFLTKLNLLLHWRVWEKSVWRSSCTEKLSRHNQTSFRWKFCIKIDILSKFVSKSIFSVYNYMKLRILYYASVMSLCWYL